MRLLRRIAEWLHPAEERAAEVSWDALRGGVDLGGAIVNPRAAENLSTILACVNAVSSAMASLPAYIYRTVQNGREIDGAHPLARLVAFGPNQYQTWADFIEWIMASVLLRGNALAEIVTDAQGSVTALRPIPWEWVSVQLLPSGRLAYDVVELVSVYGGTGRPRRLLQGEVFHLRDRSDDEGVAPRTWWPAEEAGTNQSAKRDHLRKLLPDLDPFATPKPEELISRIVHINSNPGDLVFDSFLGSGTTAAVAHKMGRRYIGIEMGEHARTHCIPRLQKVIEGEQGGISQAINWKGGGGFRFYTLGDTVFLADGGINPKVRFTSGSRGCDRRGRGRHAVRRKPAGTPTRAL